MNKELTPLETLERHKKSIDDLLDNGSILPELHYVFMQELDIIETALKEKGYFKKRVEDLEALYQSLDERYRKVFAKNKKQEEILRIIKEFADIKIDLRDETQASIISIGDRTLTISYDKAKLLKEYFNE